MPAITSFVSRSSSYEPTGSIVHSRMQPAHKALKLRKDKGQGLDAMKKRLREGTTAEEDDTDGNTSKQRKLDDDEVREDESEQKGVDEDGEHEDEDEEPVIEDSASEEESESEDEDELLRRELEKLKREKAEKAERERQEENEAREREIAFGNPLLNNGSLSGNFEVKKSWMQDSAFQNQAKNAGADDGQKEFVNDMLRTAFHRKFIRKYVQ